MNVIDQRLLYIVKWAKHLTKSMCAKATDMPRSQPRFSINEDEPFDRIWMAGVNMQMIECINYLLCNILYSVYW